MNLPEMMAEIEQAGASFRLEGEKIHIRYPDEERREKLTGQIGFLRNHRGEAATLLKAQRAVPKMPLGVRLVQWDLRSPPVGIETCAVVTDPALFARTTLKQLGHALANPKHWVGWTVPELIERLVQVGVTVLIELQASSRTKRADGTI